MIHRDNRPCKRLDSWPAKCNRSVRRSMDWRRLSIDWPGRARTARMRRDRSASDCTSVLPTPKKKSMACSESPFAKHLSAIVGVLLVIGLITWIAISQHRKAGTKTLLERGTGLLATATAGTPIGPLTHLCRSRRRASRPAAPRPRRESRGPLQRHAAAGHADGFADAACDRSCTSTSIPANTPGGA